MVALRLPEMCFWPAETRKNLEFFLRCIHVFGVVLKYALDINEGIWLQLFFYLIVLMGIVASVMGMSFIRLCFIIYIEVFSYCTLTEKFAIGFQMWFDHEWIDFRVFVGKWLLSLSSYLFALTSARMAQLLFFFDVINFFRYLGWRVFWSVL